MIKNYQPYKKTGTRENVYNRTDTLMIQILELSDTERKITVINTFKKLDDKIEDFTRELKSKKNKPSENSKIGNSINEFNNSLDAVDESISVIADWLPENIQM